MLILLYLCYQKCRDRHALSRVGSSDANQRLVSGVDVQHATTSGISHLEGMGFTKTVSPAKTAATNTANINGDATVDRGVQLKPTNANANNEMEDDSSLRLASFVQATFKKTVSG